MKQCTALCKWALLWLAVLFTCENKWVTLTGCGLTVRFNVVNVWHFLKELYDSTNVCSPYRHRPMRSSWRWDRRLRWRITWLSRHRSPVVTVHMLVQPPKTLNPRPPGPPRSPATACSAPLWVWLQHMISDIIVFIVFTYIWLIDCLRKQYL